MCKNQLMAKKIHPVYNVTNEIILKHVRNIAIYCRLKD